MADYGVQSTGYVRKPLAVILTELEEAMIAEFGADVIQTAESPLGQINGIMALALNDVDETFLDVYQSFDADVAEGPRMDILANLRRLQRIDGESDAAFRPRITNQRQANIKLTANVNRLKEIPGVTWASARENKTDATDALGMTPHSVAYAVIGGDDEAVAEAVYEMSVPGITMLGNTSVEIIHEGYCQISTFIRPVDVPIRVEIDVEHVPDPSNCAPPSIGTVTAFVIDALADEYRNGDTVVEDRIHVEAARIGNLKIVDLRIARQSNLIVAESLAMTLYERPVFVSPHVVVKYV